MSITFALILSLVAAAVARKAIDSNDASLGMTLRQSAASGTDRGILAATTWLNNNLSALNATQTSDGYYAYENKDVNWRGLATADTTIPVVDWDGTLTSATFHAKALPTDSAGNNTSYFIQRICDHDGAYTTSSGVHCMIYTPPATTSANKTGTLYNVGTILSPPQIYYRVTARTVGPKGSMSYTQALVLIGV